MDCFTSKAGPGSVGFHTLEHTTLGLVPSGVMSTSHGGDPIAVAADNTRLGISILWAGSLLLASRRRDFTAARRGKLRNSELPVSARPRQIREVELDDTDYHGGQTARTLGCRRHRAVQQTLEKTV